MQHNFERDVIFHPIKRLFYPVVYRLYETDNGIERWLLTAKLEQGFASKQAAAHAGEHWDWKGQAQAARSYWMDVLPTIPESYGWQRLGGADYKNQAHVLEVLQTLKTGMTTESMRDYLLARFGVQDSETEYWLTTPLPELVLQISPISDEPMVFWVEGKMADAARNSLIQDQISTTKNATHLSILEAINMTLQTIQQPVRTATGKYRTIHLK